MPKIFLLLFLFAFNTASAANKLIHYTDSGSGTPLVLIHAFPFDSRLWQPQQPLQHHFRLITLDLWGFGTSERFNNSGEAVDMSIYADEVKTLLDDLHIPKAIIGGESMGGYVALAFLKKYPERVSGLVLSDTQAIADNAEQRIKREATAIDVLEHGNDNLITAFLPKALSPKATFENRLFARHLMVTQIPVAIASALRGMGQRDDNTSVLADTPVPILILSGDQDAVIALEQSELMAKVAKRGRLVVIKNAGHLSNVEQPQAWNNAVIANFLH